MAIVRSLLVIFMAAVTGFALPYCYAFLNISYVQDVQVWLVTNKALLNLLGQWFSGVLAEQAMYWLVVTVTASVYGILFGAILGLLIGFLHAGRLFFYVSLWYPVTFFCAAFYPPLLKLSIDGYPLIKPIEAIGHNWQPTLVILFALFCLFFALFRGFSAPEEEKTAKTDYLFR
ncbi:MULTISPECIES: hypothetical protein [unclassified Motilimonas]|uniref:hypothetical protein n=1 Tax=Motilimonas TaxID=1914248 RepID=UPI001E4D0E88|nr:MULTISPECIES: hypothetical protein [unclassified Motilimonas]MCE0559010.1 hypothetical protein [Motilimonas sp. E26]MDO6525236.1 hypothetical protein [Motilimonas sp. 1_MG-2023]